MSGHKKSDFQLRMERQQRVELLFRFRRLRSELMSLQDWLSDGNAVPPTAASRRSEWLRGLEIPTIEALGSMNDVDAVESVVHRMEMAVEDGKHLREEPSAEDEAGALRERVASLRHRLRSHVDLIDGWMENGTSQAFTDRLDEMDQSDPVSLSAKRVDRLAGEIGGCIESARGMEMKHEKRVYLVQSLRQVSAEMGYTEIDPPHYERSNDRRTRILYMVDTHDRGRIAFSITLDGISSHSDVEDDRCGDEFSRISGALADDFGIETAFAREDGSAIESVEQRRRTTDYRLQTTDYGPDAKV